MIKQGGYRAVYVEWDDSASHHTSWTRVDEIVRDSSRPEKCYTLGFLLKETKDTIVVAGSLCIYNINNDVDGSDCMTIPKAIIKKLRKL